MIEQLLIRRGDVQRRIIEEERREFESKTTLQTESQVKEVIVHKEEETNYKKDVYLKEKRKRKMKKQMRRKNKKNNVKTKRNMHEKPKKISDFLMDKH